MRKDILEAGKENAFSHLNERWRWNLYVRPIRVTSSEHSDLLTVTKQTYERFVGAPFRISEPRRSHRRTNRTVHRRRHAVVSVPALPVAWLVSEIMKRSSVSRLAVGA